MKGAVVPGGEARPMQCTSAKPPGFVSGDENHSRGHLLARSLGGSGTDERNLVMLYQRFTNSPVMSDFERSGPRAAAARAARSGHRNDTHAAPAAERNERRETPRQRTDRQQPRGAARAAGSDWAKTDQTELRLVSAVDAVGDRERVIASVDCGFGTFAGGEFVAEDVVWQKLKACREGADLASQRLWG